MTTFVLEGDHTLGNVIRTELLQNKNVSFASYKQLHPLKNKIEFCVVLEGESTHTLQEVFETACSECINKLVSIKYG